MSQIGPNQVLDKGYLAETEVPQFHVVHQSGNEHCSIVGTEHPLGVSQDEAVEDDVERGRVINIRVFGISRAVASEAIALREPVKADADGRVSVAGEGDFVLGRCGTAADQEDDHIDLTLTFEGLVPVEGGGD